VVSGDPGALAEFEAELSARHVLRWRIPESDYIAHSAGAERLAGPLAAGLAGLSPSPGQIPLLSTVTGQWADGRELDAGYWYANVRQTVRFADAVAALAAESYRVFLEVSPHAVLTGAVTETVTEAGGLVPALVAGTLDRDDAGARRLLGALARAHVHGVTVDWAAVAGPAARLDLPTYPFQRQRYWPEPPPAAPASVPAGSGEAGTAAEGRFWAAVEAGDQQALAEALALPDGRQLDQVLPALASWRRREQDRSATAQWRYRIAWRPVPEPEPVVLGGTWLVVTPGPLGDDDLVRSSIAALTARGAQVEVLPAGGGELSRAALAARLGQLAEAGALRAVISLLALDERPAAGPDDPALTRGLAGTQELIQAHGDAGTGTPLWVLTRGAVSAGPGEPLSRLAQAAVWGLGRVAGLEHPDWWGGLVDLPPALDERAAARLTAVLAGLGEDQVAIRPAGITARRLERAAPPAGGPGPWQPSGTVLVTGGTGAVGGRVARWLAGRGAPRVVLSSRSGPAAPGAAALAAALAAAGSTAQLVASDAADRGQLTALLGRLAAGGPPLTAVMHAAGTGQATTLAETSLTELTGVLAAKAGAAAHLHELTAGLPLEQFVLFSSIAATWGSGLQPAYAAANSYLDALAEVRRSRGLAAASVAWGPWGGGGMTDAAGGEQLQRRGLAVMDPDQLLTALGQVLDGGETGVTVADVDWARFAAPFTLRRPSPLIGALPEVQQALAGPGGSPAGPAAGPDNALSQQLAGLPAADQDRLLLRLVRAQAADVLGFPSPEGVEPERAFSEMGFDSLSAVELRNRIGAATGLPLPATLLFDYPAPAVLATQLRRILGPAPAGAERPVFAELDRLEAMLGGITAADGEPAEITARLEAVLQTWNRVRENADGGRVIDKLEASTDDEVFDFIGKELGIF
jgi:short-subunit dehydrogenase/acyl carrier protein